VLSDPETHAVTSTPRCWTSSRSRRSSRDSSWKVSLTALHKSPFHGFSVEFADHREYVAGDDLKYLDWQVFARTGPLLHQALRGGDELRCYILLDRSASMAFGTGTVTKWITGCFPHHLPRLPDDESNRTRPAFRFRCEARPDPAAALAASRTCAR